MIEHKDRIPGAGKANRKLIIPEGGTPFYATVEYADDPIETGTPINKVLLDEFLAASGTTSGTSSALVLAQPGFTLVEGATVRFKLHAPFNAGATLNVNNTGDKPILNKALETFSVTTPGTWLTGIYNGEAWVVDWTPPSEPVGRIIFSRNNSLGSKYLVTNGQYVDKVDYPEIYPYLTDKDVWKYDKALFYSTSSSSTASSYSFSKANNYYFVVAHYAASSYELRCYYNLMPQSSSWQYSIIATSASNVFSSASQVFWTGTYYVCIVYQASAWVCYYTTNFILNNWNSITITNLNYSNPTNTKISYLEPYFIATSSINTASPKYCHKDNVISSSTWNITTLPSSNSYTEFVWDGTQYVVVGSGGGSCKVYTASNLFASSWTQITNLNTSKITLALCLAYLNGNYIVWGQQPSTYYSVHAYSPSLSSGWQYITYGGDITSNNPVRLYYYKGYYFMFYTGGSTYINVLYQNSLSTTFNSKTICNMSYVYMRLHSTDFSNCLNDDRLFCIFYISGTNDYRIAQYSSSEVPGACGQVPSISLANAYTFIRAET